MSRAWLVAMPRVSFCVLLHATRRDMNDTECTCKQKDYMGCLALPPCGARTQQAETVHAEHQVSVTVLDPLGLLRHSRWQNRTDVYARRAHMLVTSARLQTGTAFLIVTHAQELQISTNGR